MQDKAMRLGRIFGDAEALPECRSDLPGVQLWVGLSRDWSVFWGRP